MGALDAHPASTRGSEGAATPPAGGRTTSESGRRRSAADRLREVDTSAIVQLRWQLTDEGSLASLLRARGVCRPGSLRSRLCPADPLGWGRRAPGPACDPHQRVSRRQRLVRGGLRGALLRHADADTGDGGRHRAGDAGTRVAVACYSSGPLPLVSALPRSSRSADLGALPSLSDLVAPVATGNARQEETRVCSFACSWW